VTPLIPLHRLPKGKRAQVIELKSRSASRLDRLGSLGLMPGSWVTVLQHRPALVVRVGEAEISFDHEVAAEILVQPA
jgi:Fe2+ transport system protein FeoA